MTAGIVAMTRLNPASLDHVTRSRKFRYGPTGGDRPT